MFRFLTCLVVAAVAGVVPQDAGIPADAKATIAEANAAWLRALQSHDADSVAAPYADNAIFVTPAGTVVKGRDGVAQLMKERFATMGKVRKGDLAQDGTTRQGSLIYEWGHATLDVERPGATPLQSRGRYLTVWQKNASGRWEIIRNLSLPE